MLKVFRDNLKYLSWTLWLVIAVFVLLMIDFGQQAPGSGSAQAAATVGDLRVSFGEYERAYRRTAESYREAYGEQFSGEIARQMGLPRQVLESLVTEKILVYEARRMGLSVTDGELRQEILRLPVFQAEEGRFVGQDAYARVLRSLGYTAEEFEGSMREQILTGKVRSVLAEGIYVSDAEVERAYREQVERATIRLVKLGAERFRDSVTLDEAALGDFFDRHRETFRVPEQRRAEYLVVDRGEIQAALTLDDAEIASYYEENTDQFTREEQVRARHILLQINDQRSADEAEAALARARARIAGGEDFAVIAAALSEDPGSKERGGDLGFFGRGQMVPAFEEAAFGARPGELVGPVTTSFGAHLIQVLERRPGGVQPLDEAREAIEARLLAERARSLAEARAKELDERIRKERPESLAALEDATAGVAYRTTPLFAADDHVPGVGRATAFSTAAFDLDAGASSGPVKIGPGWALLRVTEIVEPRLPELDEVREAVESALRDERGGEAARAALAAAAVEIRGGRSLDEVAEGLGVEVEESDSFGRGDAVGSLGRSPAVVRAALALDEGGVGGPVTAGDGAVLFQVAARERFDPATFAVAGEQTRGRLESERLNDLLAALLTDRRQELGVSLSPQLLEQFRTEAAGT